MPGWIIDLDGTMYRGNMPVEGAAQFISQITEAGHPYLYVTNNSSRKPGQVAEHIRRVTGASASAENILTSSQAAARYAAGRKPGASFFAIGEEGLMHALEEAGLVPVREDEVPDFVVQGIDRGFTYDKLAKATRYIHRGAEYLLTNPDRLLPGDGGLLPGAGSVAASLKTASGTEPVVIGKPSPIILNLAVEKLGLPRNDIWVVGDNIETDIAGGVAARCRTALVLTGITRAEQAGELLQQANLKSDLICRDLPDLLLQLSQKH
ncbi:HAD-IIA family hydrolase [Paenibacillus senegalensis]|uniref:HAD-IIA family hydrolase n=1 Tax=Paenibacillus senegalensis TaxID=1465766 RepID=UPI0002893D4F|nr:HAD-IIA family hydrolase [Paenibacillus senegalensis]